MRYGFYLFLLLGSLPFVFRRPFFGLCVYFVVSFMQPKVLCWQPGLQDSMIVGVPLVLGALLFGEWRRIRVLRSDAAPGRAAMLREVSVRHRPFEPSGLLLIMLILLCYIAATRIISPFPTEPTSESHWRLWKLAAITVLMTGLTPDRRRLHILYGVAALATAFWAIKGGAWFVLLGSHQVYGADYDNNLFALKSVMALPMLYYFGRSLTRPRWRTVIFICCALTCLSVIGSGSRSGFVALAVVLLCVAWTSGHRVKAMLAAGLIATVAMVAAGADIRSRWDSILNYNADRSVQSRFVIWEVTKEMLAEYPVFGVGFGNFETAYNRLRPWSRAAHNIWLQSLAELGFLGHPLYLALIFGTIWSLWRLMRRSRHGPPELRWAYDLGRGMYLSMVAFCIHGMFHNDDFLDLMFAIVGLTVATRAVQRRERVEMQLEQHACTPKSPRAARRAEPARAGGASPQCGWFEPIIFAGRQA